MKRRVIISAIILCLALTWVGCGGEKVMFDIILSANPPEGGEVRGGGEYERGKIIVVEAEANEDYFFWNWTEDGVPVSWDTNYKFPVTGDRRLVANFKEGSSPPGYHAHDYYKLVTFLEQTDENGVKNGRKLNNNYNPEDPLTWPDLTWSEEEEKRIKEIYWNGEGLCGHLDVSGCTALEELNCQGNQLKELDVSGCTALERLYCSNTQLEELDVGDCIALKSVGCSYNQLKEFDASDCIALEDLYCFNNQLKELNVTDCRALVVLWCIGNDLTELNVSDCTALETLSCYNNQLTFSTLPLLDISDYLYSPQEKLVIGTAGKILVDESIDLSSEAEVEGEFTKFYWYAGEDETSLTEKIEPSTAANGVFTFNEEDILGKYLYCEMTNLKLPDLTLATSPVKCVESIED